jgi:hypothetical protein
VVVRNFSPSVAVVLPVLGMDERPTPFLKQKITLRYIKVESKRIRTHQIFQTAT